MSRRLQVKQHLWPKESGLGHPAAPRGHGPHGGHDWASGRKGKDVDALLADQIRSAHGRHRASGMSRRGYAPSCSENQKQWHTTYIPIAFANLFWCWMSVHLPSCPFKTESHTDQEGSDPAKVFYTSPHTPRPSPHTPHPSPNPSQKNNTWHILPGIQDMNKWLNEYNVRGIVFILGKVNMNKSTEMGMRRPWGKNTSLVQVKGEYQRVVRN